MDYVKRWSELVRARADQGRRLDREHDRPDAWAGERAARFAQMTRNAAGAGVADPFLDLVRADIDSQTTVLDVGAGAGRHVIPLARLAAHVTAVEPSPAMRGQLEAAVQQSGLANVSVVGDVWPASSVTPADVVVCSHVAYFVDDISGFLLGLRDVTRRRMFVALRHEQRERLFLPLFQQVWGEPRCLEPTFVDLFGAACQVGLWGGCQTISFGIPLTFESLDEAVSAVKRDLLNPVGPEADRAVRDFVRNNTLERDGRWQLVAPPAHAGVFTWDGAA